MNITACNEYLCTRYEAALLNVRVSVHTLRRNITACKEHLCTRYEATLLNIRSTCAYATKEHYCM